ncbi:MAG TPA: hypothetical protein VGR16_10870 [Thermomicrobiales bacterium]|nr:hypothetical protein [Thermomicrobiales bacterium]
MIEAEAAVQETWLRSGTSPTQATSTKAFLSAVVTRISIDVQCSARSSGLCAAGGVRVRLSRDRVGGGAVGSGLRELLAADVQMVGDGGGKATQGASSITGAGKVARMLGSTFP